MCDTKTKCLIGKDDRNSGSAWRNASADLLAVSLYDSSRHTSETIHCCSCRVWSVNDEHSDASRNVVWKCRPPAAAAGGGDCTDGVKTRKQSVTQSIVHSLLVMHPHSLSQSVLWSSCTDVQVFCSSCLQFCLVFSIAGDWLVKKVGCLAPRWEDSL